MQTLSVAFADGVSLGPGRFKAIAVPAADGFPLAATAIAFPATQNEQDPDQDRPNSLVLDWSREKGMTGSILGYPLTGITLSPESDSEVMVSGRFGFVGLTRGDQVVEERIEGPRDRGAIRDMRLIGQHVYAAGMASQVYRRVGSGKWERFQNGLYTSWDNATHFNAIDGLSEDDIYAVGFKGDIWHYRKRKWHKIAKSRTNLIIGRVRAVRPDLVFAAGQAGLLLRGHDDSWESVDQNVTHEEFWGLEWFQNRLYLATYQGLFRLTDTDELETIDDGFPKPRTYSKLHAGNGALWSFGERHLSWTSDGETWNEVLSQ